MKTLKKDVITEAYEVGQQTSKIAEALQNELAEIYANILLNPKIKASSVEEAYKVLQNNTKSLFTTALQEFSDIDAEVSKNASKLINQSYRGVRRIMKIDDDEKVKEYLHRITGNQLKENNKIAYKDGRQVGFKEYVEMATRTRIQHQLLEQTKELGVETMQLFYVCDTYSDCANDHLDYQGKLYYDATVWKKVPRDNPYYKTLQYAIGKCKASVEDVTTKKPYLLTRPNCRHRLIPISIDDVVDLPIKQILKNNKADKGNYKDSVIKRNYDDSQKQRRYEYAVRTAKRNFAINEKAYKETGDEFYLKRMNANRYSIRLNQKNLRTLISRNTTLKRDYRRENPYYLQKDLGVAYNTEPIRADVKFIETDHKDLVNFDGDAKQFIDTIEMMDEMTEFVKNLEPEEAEVLHKYQTLFYKEINRYMYDNQKMLAEFEKSGRDYKPIMEGLKKDVEKLHNVFLKLRKKDLKDTKTIVFYRGVNDFVKENDTTIILNGFTSMSVDNYVAEMYAFKEKNPAVFKIIAPPETHNQLLYNPNAKHSLEAEFLVDTNSVYDIIGQQKKVLHGSVYTEYTLLLRPKHKGVLR